MKTLINHLLANNLSEILSRSLKNCHCKGVDSIMLLEAPGKTIRLYVAKPGNLLYMNFPDVYNHTFEMSVGYHAHHCNLTLECIKGTLHNMRVRESPSGGFEMDKYLYHSKILNGEDAYFEPRGNSVLVQTSVRAIETGKSLTMPASDIHTVACQPDKVTAWIVYEGKEDPNYKPYCWSHSDLTKSDLSGLYGEMDKEYLESTLVMAGIL